MSQQPLPTLPLLSGDLILDVFTHKSLRYPGAPVDNEFGDNDRLALLGGRLLSTAMTLALFNKRPMLSSEEIQVCHFCRLHRLVSTAIDPC